MDQHSPHISSFFDDELNSLSSMLLNMGGIAEQQVQDAFAALLEQDLSRAASAISQDKQVNALEMSIDELAVQIIARFQPTANDLRTVFAIVKAITDLERIGDKAEKMGTLAPVVAPYLAEINMTDYLRVMARTVQIMLHDTLDAFARQDAVAAQEIIRRDEHVNGEYDRAYHALMDHIQKQPTTIEKSLKLFACMRAMERIGDHCTNICEHIVYRVQGRDIRHSTTQHLGDND